MRVLAGLLLAALIAFSPVAFARDLTAEESAAFDQTVADFNAAMGRGDMTAIAEAIPPRAIAYIATSAGITTEQLMAAMMEQMEGVMASVTIESFSMDMENAEHRELADGTPYLVIPTSTTIDMGATGKVTEKSPTLAIMDEGVWYLMRMADPEQVQILVGAYPQFAGVTFPPASTETSP
jgi:hypothetical protein